MAVLRSNLLQKGREICAAASEALLETTVDVYSISQDLVPVDTGDLKASGGTDITKIENGLAKQTVVGYGNEEIDYGPHVEYGTQNSEAQPFLTPSFTQAKEIYEHRLQEKTKAAAENR